MQIWKKYDPKARGFIHKDEFKPMLWELKQPLGFESEIYKTQSELQDMFIN
jgi:hypothetical protein